MIDFQLFYIICVPVSFLLMLSIVTHLTNRITVANALFAALISAIPYGNFFRVYRYGSIVDCDILH